MTWYNSNVSILLGITTSDCENKARHGFPTPENPISNLTDSLKPVVHNKIANFELSPSAKEGTTQNFQH